MVSKNTWNKGLNSDISKLKSSNESYLDALNLELITQDGNSSYALSNTKGTLLSFRLPDTGPTYKLDNWDELGFEISITLNTGAIIDVVVSLTGGESNEKIAGLVNDELNSTDIICYYNSNYLVLYDLNNVIASIADSNIDIQQWTYFSETFILGWGYSENNLILITCDPNVISFTPETEDILSGRLGTIGCVWYIPILNSTGQAINPDGSTVTSGDILLANNFVKYKEFLNLSRRYNIYKSVECKKENQEILRTIFSDYYNDIRTLNVLEDQIQATPVELVNILPANASRQPIITEVVEGGFLPTGRYQLWYQLNSSQGAVSTTSTLSKFITIGSQDIITEYSGNVVGSNSGKSIKVTVQNVDTNYDTIRWGYTVYQVNGLAESFYFEESPIPNNGVVDTVLNGNEENIPISDITELSNVNRPPSICKTLSVVKNKLFIANTKTRVFNPTFDAKAYRFSGIGGNNKTDAPDQTAWAYNKGDTYGNPTAADIDGISPVYPTTEEDFINPYNNENPNTTDNPFANGDWENLAQFKYQADGITLGGSGPNISYKFITKDTLEDANSDVAKGGLNVTPVNSVNQSYNLGTNIQPIPAGLATMRSPYYDSLFWGYARGEVYRWAIVFKDLYGYDSFAYWIGDIRFPDSDEFVISDIVDDTTVCYQLGIEFTLDTTTPEFQAIKDKISGWSYVRMERTTTDKTKLGTGMMDNLGQIIDPLIGASYCLTSNLNANNTLTGILPTSTRSKPIYIPSFQKNIDNEFKVNDYFKFLGAYEERSQSSIVIPANSNYRNYKFNPNIDYVNLTPITFKWSVESSKSRNYIPQDLANDLDLPFLNMSAFDGTSSSAGEYMSAGNKLDLISFTDPLDVVNNNSQDKYAISYERYITDQYGGNTRSARYNNTYIYTGHYQSYRLDQATSPSKVFGGDVVTLLYCYQVTEKNIAANTGYTIDTNNGVFRMALFFPTEAHGFNPHYLVYQPPYSEAGRCYARNGSDENILEESIPLNEAYNQPNNTVVAVSPPIRFNDFKEEPYTIYGTLNKLDGETVDTWRNFKTNNQISVVGNYGPINRLIEFKDRLYYYQQFGVGIAAVDERVMINEGSTEQTQLGTGGVLARYDYLTTETGVIHQFAVEKSGNSIYHYDALLNKIFRINDKGVIPLSDVEGISGKLNTFDKTIKDNDTLAMPTIRNIGVHIGFDSQRNKVLFTLKGLNQEVTYSFNELANCFDSRHSFIPDMYLNMKNYFISTGDHITIDIHDQGDYNSYYGVIFPSLVVFRNNLNNPDLVKVFDNLWINTEVILDGVLLNETITSLRATNDYQDTGVLSTANIIQRLRTWRWNKLRNFTDKRRMYDKYIDVQLDYLPTSNKKFILHDTGFENSERSTIKPK